MARKLKRRQIIDLVIEKVAFGGKGIAYLDEMVVFVENTLPGDQVTARVRKARKNFAEAYPLQIIQPSPLRQPAPCRHFGHCGGCKWQNVDYQQQLDFKKQQVAETLQHIGNITPEIIHDPLPADEIFGYRNKMEFSFAENGWLTPEELQNPEIKKDFALGLHVPRFYDQVINIEKCWLQSPLFNEVLNFSQDFFKASGIPVYHLRRREGILRHLVLRQSFSRQQVMVNVVTFAPMEMQLKEYARQLVEKYPYVASVINTINDKPAQVATGDEHIRIYGDPVLIENLGDFSFEISPDSFFQTNSRQALRLYNTVREYAEAGGKRVWDLYCGTGSIGIFLAREAREIIGFEIVENAVADAYRNAELNDIHNCRFMAGDLRFRLEAHAGQPPDVLICDPPRAGMHKDVVTKILEIAPRRIIYVSCNPATLARDLGELSRTYKIIRVQPVDMFPHTYHIENVVHLEKI